MIQHFFNRFILFDGESNNYKKDNQYYRKDLIVFLFN